MADRIRGEVLVQGWDAENHRSANGNRPAVLRAAGRLDASVRRCLRGQHNRMQFTEGSARQR
jgi:hypothetical protein